MPAATRRGAVARTTLRHDLDACVERLRSVYSEVAAASAPVTHRTQPVG